MRNLLYHVDTTPLYPEWLVANLVNKPKSILWLKSSSVESSGYITNWIFKFPPPLRCCYMAAKIFVGNTSKQQQLTWSREVLAGPEYDVINATIENPSFNKATCVAAGWARSQSEHVVSQVMLAAYSREKFAILALLPPDRHTLNVWSELVMAPLWLWKNESRAHSSPNPSLRADQVLLSYIDMVIDIRGVVVLQWTGIDTDVSCGVALVAEPAVVDCIRSFIAIDEYFVEDSDFYRRLVSRGFTLRYD